MAPPIKIEHLRSAHRSRLAQTSEVALDERTATDLNLDVVFRSADRTVSTLGQQALFHRLHTQSRPLELEEFARVVELFSADASARTRAQRALSHLQDPNGYDVWWLGDPAAIDSRGWHVVFPVLAGLALAAVLATVVAHQFWPVLVLALAAVVAARWLVAERISALGVVLRQVAPLIAAGERLTFLAGSQSSLGRLPEDLATLRRLKTTARWLSGDPLMLSSRPEPLAMLATALAGTVYEYLNLILLLDANGVYFASADVRGSGAALLRVVTALGDIDAAISVASWRAERSDWTTPTFTSAGSSLHLAGVRHPLIDDAVPNTLEMKARRGVLVSGSNMSGKSTFLRTVGVNAVLAQTINTCLADRYEAPFVQVRSCIGRGDDILTGKSYYLAEVEAVLALMAAADSPRPHLFLFDELFRGTNTIERIAAAGAVLEALVEDGAGAGRPHVVLAATHDDELVDLLQETYDSHHFSDRVGAEGLVFDFLLRPGPATTRNAVALLAQRGAPTRVVSRALATATALDAHRRRAG